jgi:excisionase family DNA binding protein
MTDRLSLAVAELVEALREAARMEAEAGPRAPDRLLSVAEAAALLGIGRSATYGELQTGRLRSIRVGRRRLIPAASIASYIADRAT